MGLDALETATSKPCGVPLDIIRTGTRTSFGNKRSSLNSKARLLRCAIYLNELVCQIPFSIWHGEDGECVVTLREG